MVSVVPPTSTRLGTPRLSLRCILNCCVSEHSILLPSAAVSQDALDPCDLMLSRTSIRTSQHVTPCRGDALNTDVAQASSTTARLSPRISARIRAASELPSALDQSSPFDRTASGLDYVEVLAQAGARIQSKSSCPWLWPAPRGPCFACRAATLSGSKSSEPDSMGP